MNLNKALTEYEKVDLPEDLKGKILSFKQVNNNMFPGHIMDKKLFYACLHEVGDAEQNTYYIIQNVIKAGAENVVFTYKNEVRQFCEKYVEEIVGYFDEWFGQNYSVNDVIDDAFELLDEYNFWDKEGEPINKDTIAYCYLIQKTSPMYKNKKFDVDLFFDFCSYFDGMKYRQDASWEAYYWTYLFCIEGACWEFENLSDMNPY